MLLYLKSDLSNGIQKVIAAIILTLTEAKELSTLTSLELPIPDGRKFFTIEYTATDIR